MKKPKFILRQMKNKQQSFHPMLLIGFGFTAASYGIILFSDSDTAAIVRFILISCGIFCMTFGIVKTIKMRRNSAETTTKKEAK